MTDASTPHLTDWEVAEIDRANESGLTPVAFVHGLWLLSSSCLLYTSPSPRD